MKYKEMTQRTVPYSILKELNAVHDLRFFFGKKNIIETNTEIRNQFCGLEHNC